MNSFKRVRTFQIDWNLGLLVFEERGRPEYSEKNLSEQGREPIKDSTHILKASTPGFEPKAHCWEASALTTAPPVNFRALAFRRAFFCAFTDDFFVSFVV